MEHTLTDSTVWSTSGWDRRPSPTWVHPPGPLNMDCSCLAPLPETAGRRLSRAPGLPLPLQSSPPGLSLTFPQQGGWEKRPQPAFFLRVKVYKKKFGEKLVDYRETGGETAGIHVLMVTQHIPRVPHFSFATGLSPRAPHL